MEPLGLLIVEDDRFILRDLETIVDWAAAGLQPVTAMNGRQGLTRFQEHSPALVITDVRMPFMDGIEMLDAIRRQNPFVETMFLSAFDDYSLVREGLRGGARDYILKSDISPSLMLQKAEELRRAYLESAADQLSRWKTRCLEGLRCAPMPESELDELAGVCSCFPASLFSRPLGQAIAQETGCEPPQEPLIPWLQALNGGPESESAALVRQAAAFIEQHYADPALKNADISRCIGVSERKLSEVFRAERGQTLNDYLIDVRIKTAKRLLRETELRIYEIAERSGYGSSAYFSTAFTRTVGVSPADYRREAQK
ncbi:MAG: helix-turn-helix domain-containing protein [Oscillospiraceae bacterium]|nr:helix-turn-helix domain-containing protein [Oscillospiraceae bacterium]